MCPSIKFITQLRNWRVCLVLFCLALPSARAQHLDTPFVPTPQDVVYRMYEMAGLEAGDYVIDLGSGDGRLVITAARMGAAGHGIEKRADLIEEAWNNARQAGVTDRVQFIQGDIFEADLRGASVITLYLLPEANIQLRPKLLKELRPGTRVVSHSFNMGEWEPDMSEVPDAVHHIYLWTIPARLAGQWAWRLESGPHVMDVEQKFQKVDLDIRHSAEQLETREVNFSGSRISFLVRSNSGSTLYSGLIFGDEIEGIAQVREKQNQRIERWTARRILQ